MMKNSDIASSTIASDQRILLSSVPITVFPIPIVKILVNVEAGSNNDVGITAEFPITICTARASPNARAIPNTIAVKIPERELRSTTFQIVWKRVAQAPKKLRGNDVAQI